MTLGKGLLVAGAVGVGGYLIYQYFRPNSAAPLSRGRGAPYTASSGDLIGGLVAAAGALAHAASPSGSNSYGPQNLNFWNSPAAESANFGDPYTHSTDAGSYSAGAIGNYGYADTHPGTALPEGVYGPPVPSPAEGLSAGDNTESTWV